GGVCAFPDCNKRLLEPGNTDDDAAFLGEMAHIVADSRQGPRGNVPMSDEDRDKHTNLLLVCGDHHKIIDSQARTYLQGSCHCYATWHDACPMACKVRGLSGRALLTFVVVGGGPTGVQLAVAVGSVFRKRKGPAFREGMSAQYLKPL